MKREQFINYLLHPDELKGENAVALNSLIKEFPYFQSAQLLYLKSLHNEKSIHYQSQLKIAAAYSANRKSLYFLINGEPAGKNSTSTSPDKFQTKESEVLETLQVQASSEIKNAEQLEDAITIVKEAETDEHIQVTEYAELIITTPEPQEEVVKEIKEILVSVPEPAKEFIKADNKDELDTLINAEVINASMEESISKMASLPVQKHVNEIVEEPKIVDVKTKIIATPKQEVHSFLDWLKLAEGHEIKPVKEVIKPVEVAIKTNDKKVLIEKFITTEPRITPKKQEFYNPINKARQSVMENDSIVSETLALIYVKQGNFSRALKSYEILSLKFPEKSTYFAAQILKVKELQHDRK